MESLGNHPLNQVIKFKITNEFPDACNMVYSIPYEAVRPKMFGLNLIKLLAWTSGIQEIQGMEKHGAARKSWDNQEHFTNQLISSLQKVYVMMKKKVEALF